MTWGMVGAAAVTVVGGAMASKGSKQSQTQKQELDPRMQGLLYGNDPDNIGGLLGDAQARYKANPSGMNQQMIDGWNRQYGLLTDPSVQAGYQGMRNSGNALMQLPIAGNPFTQPGGYSRSMFGGGQQGYGGQQQGGQQQRQPASQQGPAPAYNPSMPQQSDINSLYASIGRTGQNAPGQSELDYWKNTGLQGDQLRQRFLTEGANYAGEGFDQFKQNAQGLLSGMGARQPFSLPAAPTAPAAPPPTPDQQYEDWLRRYQASMSGGSGAGTFDGYGGGD